MFSSWLDILRKEKKKDYFLKIFDYINERERNGVIIYPKKSDIFNAFYYTSFYDLKIVIIGQDPYFRPNQAHGLSFSVPFNIKIPNSLLNIYKELKRDISDFVYPDHGCLISWAKQGVLLLNSILTVEKNKPYSHFNIGWERFTDNIIENINRKSLGIIFMLWGVRARSKIKLINNNKHFILTSSHPSPFSFYKGFFGCSHFSIANNILKKKNKVPINWNV